LRDGEGEGPLTSHCGTGNWGSGEKRGGDVFYAGNGVKVSLSGWEAKGDC